MERIDRLLGDGTTMNTVRRAELAVLRTLQAKGGGEVPAALGAEHKTAVQLLHDAGLVDATYVLSGDIRVRLTPAGLAELAQLDDRLTDPRQRRHGCRVQLLRWLDADPDARGIDDFMSSRFGTWYDQPFERNAAVSELLGLKSGGLVSGHGAWSANDLLRPRLTPAGRAAIDGFGPVSFGAAGGPVTIGGGRQSTSLGSTSSGEGPAEVYEDFHPVGQGVRERVNGVLRHPLFVGVVAAVVTAIVGVLATLIATR